MSAPLWIRIDPRPFERIPAELACISIFRDELPLRGAAALADWRLCGALSELRARERFRAEVGEVVLLPSGGRLASERLLLVGLGERQGFDLAACGAAAEEAVRRALALTLTRLVMPIAGAELDDIPRHLPVIVAASLRALSASPPPDRAVALQIPSQESELARCEAVLAPLLAPDRVALAPWAAEPSGQPSTRHPRRGGERISIDASFGAPRA